MLNAGGIRMKVSFTGGSATAFGVCHAEFTTKDELTQFVIENSDKFKNGTIYLEKTTVIGEPETIDRSPSVIDDDEPKSAIVETPYEVEQIKVADKSEAIEWLKERYPDKGYTQRGLRNKTDFDAACKECGVSFSY